MTNDPIFDSANYQEQRKPLLQASTLPPGCYTSETFFSREVERVFGQHWQFVGRVEQWPEVGSYRCFDGPAGPLILVRTSEYDISAYANSCRHRGARLLDGDGECRRIVCPYHSWSYRLDGRLAGSPGMQQVQAFDPERFPLLEYPVQTWAGFVFVHYQASPPPLLQQLGNLPQKFDAHDCGGMRFTGGLDFEIDANWKLLAENALEAYHTGSVHRDTLGQQQSRPLDDTRGGWTGLLVEDEYSVATLPGEDNPFPYIEGLGDEAMSGAYFTMLFPSTQFVFAQDCMWWLAFLPVSASRTRLGIGACFPESTIDLPDFEEKLEPYFDRWQRATAEDNAICEQQQLGQAVSRPAGRFAASEFAVHEFDNWILDQVLES